LTHGWPTAIVRHIPNQQDQTELAATFKALADPTRLAVVERLSIGPAGATELAGPFTMALPSFMQHLAVLEHAGIVSSHKAGRTRIYQLTSGPLTGATNWLSTHRNHWQRRLDQLDQLLTTTDPNRKHP
jgi:DNA-binding transcriptional ArsR family regulator